MRVFFPHLIFPLSCPAEEGSDRAAWWAPSIQPRSTHHNLVFYKHTSEMQKCYLPLTLQQSFLFSEYAVDCPQS